MLSSEPRSIVIGTAGHIDHGKTTLVKALTGADTDRLPEEKRRGITVDLGFASLETSCADGNKLRFGFVDVPGHHLFIHNMLAGAGGIDCALLVISAEEGVKPQTIEHVQILELLGIRAGLTVLTKSDAVDEATLRQKTVQVERFLRGRYCPVIPVSAKTGTGLEDLRVALRQLAAHLPVRTETGLLRLPVDRSFVMKGFGTVVTGSLRSGEIVRGQQVMVQPGLRKSRVRGLQIHGKPAERAFAGTRVAVNLADVETAEVTRGQALVEPDSFVPATEFDAEVEVLDGAPAMKHQTPVHVYAFTAASDATILIYGQKAIGPGERALARLKLKQPLVVANRDRFVLRQWSPLVTIGGGTVLDVYPPRRMSKTQRAAWLTKLRAAKPEEELQLRLARATKEPTSLRRLAVETGLSEQAIRSAMTAEAPIPVAQKPVAQDPVEARRLAEIAKIFAASGLASPTPEEVAAQLKIALPEMRKWMTLLLRDKTLLKIGLEEFYLHKQALEDLRKQLQKWKGRDISVPEFKTLTGLTRKRAVPLLEQLDRLHWTQRNGDMRRVL